MSNFIFQICQNVVFVKVLDLPTNISILGWTLVQTRALILVVINSQERKRSISQKFIGKSCLKAKWWVRLHKDGAKSLHKGLFDLKEESSPFLAHKKEYVYSLHMRTVEESWTLDNGKMGSFKLISN